MFTVEQVVAQNLPNLQKHPALASCAKFVLRQLLHEREFIEFEEKYPHLTGLDFVEQVLEYFDFSYSINDKDMERIPPNGRVVIIANHPIGSLDGLALIKLISEVRSDLKVVANQLLMTVEPLNSLLLPVNNMNGSTPKENISRINGHLENEGAVLIFPAGEVSRLKPNGIRDSRWHSGFVKIATSAKAPVLPMFVDGKNSPMFYGLSLLSKPLSTLFLVKEMFKQARKEMPVKVGDIIPYDAYSGLALNNKEKVRLFKRHLYKIAKNRRPLFKTQTAIAHPENRTDLKQAIESCDLIGETSDKKQIYLYKFSESSPILREIGRLREVAFRAVGEGSGLRRDIDRYDAYYEHLILWDQNDLEIVGAYRLGDTNRIVTEKGQPGLYTDSLFDYGEEMQRYLSQGLELGRSFVQPRYWGKRSLDYLWYGIGAYLVKNPEVRYLFGPVSISNTMPKPAKDLLVYFYKLHFGASADVARSKMPYDLPADFVETIKEQITGENYKIDFTNLKSLLANMGCTVPTLYKQYSEVCEPGGVEFLDFGVDPDFGDCIDGLVLVDSHKLKARKRDRYMSSALAVQGQNES